MLCAVGLVRLQLRQVRLVQVHDPARGAEADCEDARGAQGVLDGRPGGAVAVGRKVSLALAHLLSAQVSGDTQPGRTLAR